MTQKLLLETKLLSEFVCAFFAFANRIEGGRFGPGFQDVVSMLARDRPKGHRAALRELLNDCLGISSDWTSQQRRQFEDVCRADGLPTLADYRAVLSRRVSRLVEQGEARSEADAVLLQAVLSDEMLPATDEDREKIEDMLDAVEEPLPEESKDDPNS